MCACIYQSFVAKLSSIIPVQIISKLSSSVSADIQKELVSVYREAFGKELAWLKGQGKSTTCSMEPLVAFTWIFGGKTLFIAR